MLYKAHNYVRAWHGRRTHKRLRAQYIPPGLPGLVDCCQRCSSESTVKTGGGGVGRWLSRGIWGPGHKASCTSPFAADPSLADPQGGCIFAIVKYFAILRNISPSSLQLITLRKKSVVYILLMSNFYYLGCVPLVKIQIRIQNWIFCSFGHIQKRISNPLNLL